MAREDFVRDLWKADRALHPPRPQTDRPNADRNGLAKLLRHADLWLTPHVVEKYRPDDFSAVPAERQAELKSAVDDFRRVAAASPTDVVAEAQQAQQGSRYLGRIVSVLQGILKP